MSALHDTIAAIATPIGEGGIGILRISGTSAITAASRLFFPHNGSLQFLPDHQLTRGSLRDLDGNLLDDALAVVMPKGNSYTGEDTVELHCHGSPTLLQTLLEQLFQLNVRLATAGEFTHRAFLNGNLDLTQAEAVIDLITAPNAAAVRNAANQLQGALKEQVGTLWATITNICAHFYACIDYSDDDIADLDRPTLTAGLTAVHAELAALSATYERGKRLREGVQTAVVGKPNVGKSSLLNALLGYDRAIVSPQAGTTRDTISESVQLNNTLFRLTDTAGLRDSDDTLEQLGVARTRAALDTAELVLLVLDASQPLSAEDHSLLTTSSHQPTILILNKSDLQLQLNAADFPAYPHSVTLSAATGDGMDALIALMCQLTDSHRLTADGHILTNARHADAVTRAANAIQAAQTALNTLTPDVVVCELEAALEALSQLTGRHVSQSIVDTIFARFCVGK